MLIDAFGANNNLPIAYLKEFKEKKLFLGH
jgi:hypothetical protein